MMKLGCYTFIQPYTLNIEAEEHQESCRFRICHGEQFKVPQAIICPNKLLGKRTNIRHDKFLHYKNESHRDN